jgi:hypothetical protein
MARQDGREQAFREALLGQAGVEAVLDCFAQVLIGHDANSRDSSNSCALRSALFTLRCALN